MDQTMHHECGCELKIDKRLDIGFVISKVKKDDEKLFLTFDKALSDRMNNTYVKAANLAVEASVKAVNKRRNTKPDSKDVKIIKKIVDKVMNNAFNDETLKKINKDITKYYVLDREFFVEDNNIKLEDGLENLVLKAKVKTSFDIVDKDIVEGIQQQNTIAAQNLYKKNFAKHVTESITMVVKEDGLNRSQMGPKVEKQLLQSLGLKPRDNNLVTPPKFTGTSKDYFSGLSTTTLNRAQNFNRIKQMNFSSITSYVIDAILDRRTSVICNSMNGKVFTVESGMRTIEQVLSSKSTEGLKSVAPWRKDLSSFGKNPSSDDLAKAGMALPPYHFRCRTQVRITGTSTTTSVSTDTAVTKTMARGLSASAPNLKTLNSNENIVAGQTFLLGNSKVFVLGRSFVTAKNAEYVQYINSDGAFKKVRTDVFRSNAKSFGSSPDLTKGGILVAKPKPKIKPVSKTKPVAVKPKEFVANPTPVVDAPKPIKVTKKHDSTQLKENIEKALNVELVVGKKVRKDLLFEISDQIEKNPILLKITQSETVTVLNIGGRRGTSTLGRYTQTKNGNEVGVTTGGLLENPHRTIKHEIGHAFHKLIIVNNNESLQSNSLILIRNINVHSAFGRGPYVSNYAKVNPAEDFAESFAEYLMNPDMFRENFKDKAKALDELIEKHLDLKVKKG